MKNNIIAHISDIHVRFGSRHDEYRVVFMRTLEDLKKIKPRRIVFAGDLFHIKITLSPNSIELVGWFLQELAKIAPVDLIIGNHDLNLQSLSQGNAISPIVELFENGYIIKKDTPELPVPKEGNGIYLFMDSGFYNIDSEIVYGVYSCLDNEIITLSEKAPDKKYIALYHGAVYGCRGDNGYEMKSDELMRPTIFNNFDIVMLGDIHEHQAFERDNGLTMSYPGSLIQQGFGESMEKGYLIWDLKNNSFKRKIVLNDFGYSKALITAGENIEERVRNLKMSLNKKKTKVEIEYEDYEENYSVEKLNQIEHIIKKIHGCETINVDWKPIIREIQEVDGETKEEQYLDSENFEKLLTDYLEKNDFEDIDDVIELSREIDKKINIKSLEGKKWTLKKMIVSNLFSFPEQETVFDFENMKGITGIFGENYTGKSNIIRSLIWVLYKKILDEGDANKLVNLYTSSDSAYAKGYIEIESVIYCLERRVKLKNKKDGSVDVSYNINYSKWNGTDWEKENSEDSATEKTQTETVISDAIGTFDDFTKVVLQSQSGTGSYLTLGQQPKNDLINRYLGLEIFRDRYDVANDTFKKIKAVQKSYGDPVEIESKIEEQKIKQKEEDDNITSLLLEKTNVDKKIDEYNENIIELTKGLIKIENIDETNEDVIKNKIKQNENAKNTDDENVTLLKDWLSKNFKKEVPNSTSTLSASSIQTNLNNEQNTFKTEKETYVVLEKWIKENIKKEELTKEQVDEIENKISDIKDALVKLRDKLAISKGEKCPTCSHVKSEPNPTLEKECLNNIEKGEKALDENKNKIEKNKNIISENNKIDKEVNRLQSIKNSLQSRKMKIDALKVDLENIIKLEEVKKHNLSIDSEQSKLDKLIISIDTKTKEIERLKNQLDIISKNKDAIKNNSDINKKIDIIKDDINVEKVVLSQLDNKIRESGSNKSIAGNNLENLNEKIGLIKESERIYKKYSIYIQAVHRDGIPAQIIKNKLPVINYRINNVLKSMVNFKIELYIKMNGDIKEHIYFNKSKSDSLPLSMGSGAQKFIGSVAIKDALHFVSRLTKPSLCIIDEGFGTLDDKHTIEIQSLLSYFKTRYQNTWVITHKNEVKDFVDNIIQTSKNTKGVSDAMLLENANAGVTVVDFV